MNARDDAIEAVQLAAGTKWAPRTSGLTEWEAAAVVDAAEPIIRADERAKRLGSIGVRDSGTTARASIEADLRERIAQSIEAQATTQECISTRTPGPPIPPDIDCGCWVCADHRTVDKFARIARDGTR